MTTNAVLTPHAVLAAAFGDHDFIRPINDHEVVIRTSEPIADQEHTVVVVEADTNPLGEGESVSYRYRITFDGPG
jgi:hypothetical protein